MNPAAPAAALVCPIWDFTEPMAIRESVSVNTDFRAANSATSPALVAVPCASRSPTVVGLITGMLVGAAQRLGLSFGARRIHAGRAPSDEEPMPRMTAWISSPSRSASLRRLSATMPTPSPMMVPSAPSEKGRQSPVGEGRRLGKAHVHHHVVQGVDAARQHQIGLVTDRARAAPPAPPRVNSRMRRRRRSCCRPGSRRLATRPATTLPSRPGKVLSTHGT